MEITGRERGLSVTSLPYHCYQTPALLAVWVPVILVAVDPLRCTWLTSDLKQTPTWSKQSRPGYRHLTHFFSAGIQALVLFYSFFNIGAILGGVINATSPPALPSRKRPANYFTGGRVGPGAGWDGSFPHQPSKPEPSSLRGDAIPNMLTRSWILNDAIREFPL
jgi:hypothetical protein